mgnify:CR=1 FL=1
MHGASEAGQEEIVSLLLKDIRVDPCAVEMGGVGVCQTGRIVLIRLGNSFASFVYERTYWSNKGFVRGPTRGCQCKEWEFSKSTHLLSIISLLMATVTANTSSSSM